MRFLEEREQEVLAYVEAVHRQGRPLSWRQFTAFASAPKRKKGRTEWSHTRKITSSLSRMFENIPTEVIEEPESLLDYFIRLGWVQVEPDLEPESEILITELGSAVLRHQETATTPAESDLTIVLDPKDPFSYPRVIGRIADLGESMLVDAYFGLDQLTQIAVRTSVTRVLTSYRKTSEIAALGSALDTMNFERPFDIRVAEKGTLHDRYIIAANGRVHFIGTSLSGIGKKPSAMGEIHGGAAAAIKELHENIWKDAEEVSPKDIKTLVDEEILSSEDDLGNEPS